MKTLIEQYNDAKTMVGRRMSGLVDYLSTPLHGPIPLDLLEPVLTAHGEEYFIEARRMGGVATVVVSSMYKKGFRPMRIRRF
jgi:hypothetical protein